MAGGRKPSFAGGDRSRTLQEMRDSAPQPAPEFGADDETATKDKRKPMLPPDSPVVPLGVLGSKLVFLDGIQQIQIAANDCRKGDMKLWFGNDFLLEHFPQLGKGGKATGQFDQDRAQTALIADCRVKGPFNPQGKVMGRGAHAPKQDPDMLVLHMGRRVLLANAPDAKGQRGQTVRQVPAGMVRINGKDAFFPAMDALPPPADRSSPRSEAEALLKLFKRWNWAEAEAAPLLLLGWVAQGFICGALVWRAHVWIPGPTASGKSTLQKHIRSLLTDWCLETADASEAAIRQILGNDTLPVSIDEAEGHDNPARLQAVMNLIKKSSSGDKILRGGQDHKGQEFTAQSCFLLSSVIHATLRGEDRNRIALLELRPLKTTDGYEPMEMEWARWRATGRALHRRMINQWPRFARTLTCYKRAIADQRFEGRWQDTYGTLLACADLALYDYAPDDPLLTDINPINEPGMERVHEAVANIRPLLLRGRTEARTDTERVVQYLVSHVLPGAHGQPGEPVGTWLDRAMETSKSFEGPDAFMEGPNETARSKLKTAGMRVVTYDPDGRPKIADALLDDHGWESGYLAIAYSTNKSIAQIFAHSEWAGDGYRQSLAKLEGTFGPLKVRFGGSSPDNALLVPLRHFQGNES